MMVMRLTVWSKSQWSRSPLGAAAPFVPSALTQGLHQETIHFVHGALFEMNY